MSSNFTGGYHGFGTPSEVNMLDDIYAESLSIMGQQVLYCPKKYLDVDYILNEPLAREYKDYFLISVVVDGRDYAGADQGFTRFGGFYINDSVKIIVSKSRFATVTGMKKPMEDDVIFFPPSKQLFVINNVYHKDSFFQLGNVFGYTLECSTLEINDKSDNIQMPEGDFSDTISKALEKNTEGFSRNQKIKEEADRILPEQEYNPLA
jgi:hypothetical protein